MYSVNDTLQAGWVFPFGDPRIKARLSAPRGISQISTSFIAYYRLGIHRMRLFTWPYNPKQPFWLDLFRNCRVAMFTRCSHVENHAPLLVRIAPCICEKPLRQSRYTVIDEKISAPKSRKIMLPIDLSASFVWNADLKPNNENGTTAFVADTDADGL